MREDDNQPAPKQHHNTFVKQRAFRFGGRRFLALFQPPFNKHGPNKNSATPVEKRVWDCAIREVRGHEILALAVCKFTIEQRGCYEPEPFLIGRREQRWSQADAEALFLAVAAQFPKAKPTDDYNFGVDCEGKCDLCQGVRKNNEAVAALDAARIQKRLADGYEVEA